MHLHTLTLVFGLAAPVFGLGRQCCCDRYRDVAIDNQQKVIDHCYGAWQASKNGASGADYCSSQFCIGQQSAWNAFGVGKCVYAGYNCGTFRDSCSLHASDRQLLKATVRVAGWVAMVKRSYFELTM